MRIGVSLAAAAVLAFAAAPAAAATLMQEVSFDVTHILSVTAQSSYAEARTQDSPLAFAAFDPRRGVLTAVEWQLSSDQDLQTGVMVEGTGSHTLSDGHAYSTLTLHGNVAAGGIVNLLTAPGPINCATGVAPGTCAATASVRGPFDLFYVEAGPALADYLGVGPLDVELLSQITLNGGGKAGIGLRASGQLDWVGTLGLTYVYAPTGSVPEPGAWALMILGFAGVGAVIRRRRLAAA